MRFNPCRFMTGCTAAPLLIVIAANVWADPTLVWRNAGPGGGGWIQSIAMDPKNPDVIHVGCDVGGYYQSRDGGRTFRIQNRGLTDYFVQEIVVDPIKPAIIYLATQSGVFKSSDGGATWKLKRKGFPPASEYNFSAPVGALVLDPSDPRVLYAGIGRPRRCTAGRGQIYKSIDAGESWRLLDGIATLAPGAVIHRLALRPDRPNVLFAATDKGLFMSRDAGVSWSRREAGLPHRYLRNVLVHPRQPDVMYAVLWSPPGETPWRGGVYRSDDGGATWASRNNGLPQQVAPPGDAWQKTCNYIRIAVDPRDPDRVYVGANSWWGAGLYRSDDGGRNWKLCTRRRETPNTDPGWITFWGIAVKCLAVSPLHPDTVVFGDSGRVLRSDDAGRHWRPIYSRRTASGRWQGNGLEVTCLNSVTVDPFQPRKLFCGYADIGLMISDDGGTTWVRRIRGLPAQGDIARVVCDPQRRDIAWCCDGKPGLGRGGVSLTADGGLSWHVVGSPQTGLPKGAAAFLTLDPSTPPEARTLYVVSAQTGLFKSVDSGRTWTACDNGLGNPAAPISALTMDPTDPKRLLAARRATRDAPLGGLFETRDSAAHWKQINRGIDFPDIRAIAIDPAAPRTVFLACRRHYNRRLKRNYDGGVFRSADGGQTWKLVFKDRFASSVRVNPHNHLTVYAGTTRHPYHDNPVAPGFLVSTDGGLSWTPANDGLSLRGISTIEPDPHDPRRVYAGTGGNGLFIGEWRP
ncbi:MAG: hypothetical protein GXP31_09575 [Kiritimatiellaeota bacterium]|nr:hypothetical protein [Kiritimatiellota bacterium]